MVILHPGWLPWVPWHKIVLLCVPIPPQTWPVLPLAEPPGEDRFTFLPYNLQTCLYLLPASLLPSSFHPKCTLSVHTLSPTHCEASLRAAHSYRAPISSTLPFLTATPLTSFWPKVTTDLQVATWADTSALLSLFLSLTLAVPPGPPLTLACVFSHISDPFSYTFPMGPHLPLKWIWPSFFPTPWLWHPHNADNAPLPSSSQVIPSGPRGWTWPHWTQNLP